MVKKLSSSGRTEKIKTSTGDRAYYAVCYAVITLLALAVLYPILYVIAASFSSAEALMQGKVFIFPVEFNTIGYQEILKYDDIWIGYRNTIFYTLFGTLLNVSITMMCAYPLARKGLYGKKGIMLLFTFSMLFNGGMIPNYILVKKLGIMNTIWAILLPGAMSVYNMIVARTFIQNNIPNEILESAQIDGCSDIRFFFQMVLPLSKAVIAVLALWYAVVHWNSYFNAFLYLSDKKLYPLQIFLKDILVSTQLSGEMEDPEVVAKMATLQYVIKYALIVVSTAPLFAVYPFVQKHFVKGVTIGSVKG